MARPARTVRRSGRHSLPFPTHPVSRVATRFAFDRLETILSAHRQMCWSPWMSDGAFETRTVSMPASPQSGRIGVCDAPGRARIGITRTEVPSLITNIECDPSCLIGM